MNESDIVADTTVGIYRIATYDTGLMWETSMWVEDGSVKVDEPWSVERYFSEADAVVGHRTIVLRVTRGELP